MPPSSSKPSIAVPGFSGRFDLVVVGVSAGGVDLLLRLLPALPPHFPVPIVVCLHAPGGTTVALAEMLDARGPLPVREACDKECLRPGAVYLVPGGYHLYVERDYSCSLSLDAPEKFARPSIDVLFDSAARACRERLLAVVLSGANDDGAEGARQVKAAGGAVVVQDPADAHTAQMPRAALAAVEADHVVASDQLAALLTALCRKGEVP